MIDYGPLIDRWQQDVLLAPWAERLHTQIASGLAVERYGDLPRWLEALAALPDITATTRRLNSARVGCLLYTSPSPRD